MPAQNVAASNFSSAYKNNYYLITFISNLRNSGGPFATPVSHQRDLYDSIEKGDFPRWTMFIQVMPEKDAATCPYNPST